MESLGWNPKTNEIHVYEINTRFLCPSVVQQLAKWGKKGRHEEVREISDDLIECLEVSLEGAQDVKLTWEYSDRKIKR